MTAFRGLATWIDVYERGPWETPERAVRGWARRGVRTVFIQTSNHRRPRAVHRPVRLARLLAAVHRKGMRAVGWYLPGFRDVRRDWRRVRAAVTYESAAGHRFDGFAMDIEATLVRDVRTRNRRMLELSSRLRRLVRGRYPLGRSSRTRSPNATGRPSRTRRCGRCTTRSFRCRAGRSTCAESGRCTAIPARRSGASAPGPAIRSSRSIRSAGSPGLPLRRRRCLASRARRPRSARSARASTTRPSRRPASGTSCPGLPPLVTPSAASLPLRASSGQSRRSSGSTGSPA